MSRPAGAAVGAARKAALRFSLSRADEGEVVLPANRDLAELMLDAAHDPSLGMDRSVCLRDVVEALHEHGSHGKGEFLRAADVVERAFGGGA